MTTSFLAQCIAQSPLSTWNQQPSSYYPPQPQYVIQSLLSSWYHQPSQFSPLQLSPTNLQQQEQSISYVFDEMLMRKEACRGPNCEVLVFDEIHGKESNSVLEYVVVEETNTKEFVSEELTRRPMDFSKEKACKTLEISLEEIVIVENGSSGKPSEMDSGNSNMTNKLCVVMLDTVGPKLQVVVKSEHAIPLEANAFVVSTPKQEKEVSSELLPINFNGLAKATKPGDTIFIGRYLFTGSETTSVWLEVSELKGDDVEPQQEEDGIILSKGMYHGDIGELVQILKNVELFAAVFTHGLTEVADILAAELKQKCIAPTVPEGRK